MSVDSSHDRFELRILFATNPLAGDDAFRPVLDTLVRNAGRLAPTQLRPRYDKIVPLTADAVGGFLKRQKGSSVLVLTGEQGVAFEWTGYPAKSVPASKLVVRIPFAALAPPDSADLIVGLTKALCTVCPPLYGWGHSAEDVSLAKDPHATDAFAPPDLKQAYWLTILGADMVTRFDRARILATPAARIEALHNGTILIVTSPTPAELLSPAAREAQAKALAHLRGEPADGVLHDLLDRSAKLQSVESPWDPDVADLFRMIVDAVPLDERRAKQVELNAHRAPAATEWRPASKALPTDVEDASAAVASYERAAETFVAGYHDQLPGLQEGAPSVLVSIDALFYLRESLRKDPAALERLMLPTLGAYLGVLIARELDGQWIPRRNPMEAQVVVGDRAWLPFLRVQRFLQSKAAALDYSLTRYYREAERHRPAAS